MFTFIQISRGRSHEHSLARTFIRIKANTYKIALSKQLRSLECKKFIVFLFGFCFDNQFRIYKPSYVRDVSLTIRTVEILQDYYLMPIFWNFCKMINNI